MTEENDNTPEQDLPETEGVKDSAGGFYGLNLSTLFDRANPKPDTAQGVGDLLTKTAEFVETRGFAMVDTVHLPDGTPIPLMLKPGGSFEFLDLAKLDLYSPNPTYRRGRATLTSLDSLIAHINRFGDGDSAVFANESRSAPSLTAVLDYHRADLLATDAEEETDDRVRGEYRHGLHRSTFAFPLSDQWKAWHESNGTKMGMADFAVFLEDNVLDVADMETVPEGAKRFVEMNGGASKIADWSVLNMLAKSLTIYENAVVTEAVNLSSGEGQLTLSSGHDTEVAGVKATVPTMFFIAIPIFREGVVYRLPVRLRYRKAPGGVVFWYELWRSDRAFDDAFHEAVERVRSETVAQVFFGSPEIA